MDAEIPISDSRRRYRENSGAQDKDSLRMERDRDTGAQYHEGSCAYGSDDTAEDVDIRRDGNHKGEDSDSAL